MDSKKSEGLGYNFLNDRPTICDEIGTHSKIAESLMRIIHSNLRRPFVIGLFGAWGVGKSSIVEMLQEKAKEVESTTKVVVIDAWRKSKETFIREFVKKLARELLSENEAKKVASETDIRKVERTSSWKPGRYAKYWFRIFVVLVVVLAVTLIAFWKGNPESKFPADKLALMLLTVFVAVYFQYILPLYSLRSEDTIEDVTLHDVMHFRRIYFNNVIGQCRQGTVCIVIDNLDRVDADDALQIMRAIKTFLVDVQEKGPTEESKDAVPRSMLNKVVFVIPCDDKAIKSHIVKSKGSEDPNEFLRKFFNVSLRIPDFNDRDCYRYACGLLDQTNLELAEIEKDKIANIIKSLFGANARQPKIFINNFLARYTVAAEFEKEGKVEDGIVTKHLEWFAVYVALDTEFSDLEMPNTVEGLQAMVKAPGGHQQQYRVSFLQKVGSIVERISPEAWAAYHYLKKANDYLLIDGYPELEDAALKGSPDFVNMLKDVMAKNPNAIELLWNAAQGAEARITIMNSILKAKERLPELALIGRRAADEMAELIHRRIHDLPALPSGIAYRDILKPREDVLNQALIDIESQDPTRREPELYVAGGQKGFQVQLVREVLEDDNPPRKVVGRLGKVLDFLGNLTDELTLPALECGKYTSPHIMEKSIGFFQEGYKNLSPQRLVDYCANFQGNACVQYLQRIVQGLNQNIKGVAYPTRLLCETATKVKELIDRENEAGVNVGQVEVVNTIAGLNRRYDGDQDWNSRHLILKTFWEYANLKAFPQCQNNAKNSLVQRGTAFLKEGEVNAVFSFLAKEQEIIKAHFQGVLPAIAGRSERLCHTVIDDYPDSTESVIGSVFPSQPEWVIHWIQKRSNSLKQRAVSVQSALLTVASQTNHNMDTYRALSSINVSEYENARRMREEHFSDMLNARGPLTSAEKLEFVLQRILIVNYKPNEEQCAMLDNAINKIDQSILSGEQKDIIRRYGKLKKAGGQSRRRKNEKTK